MKQTGLPKRQGSPSPWTWEPVVLRSLIATLVGLLLLTLLYGLITSFNGSAIWARPLQVCAYVMRAEHGLLPALGTALAYACVVAGYITFTVRRRSRKTGRRGLASAKDVTATLGEKALMQRAQELRPDLTN